MWHYYNYVLKVLQKLVFVRNACICYANSNNSYYSICSRTRLRRSPRDWLKITY